MSSESTSQSEPTTPEEYRQRALLLADLGRYDEAAGELAAGLASAPDDAGLLTTLARLHVAAGQAVAALAAADRAAAASPGTIEPLVVRAMALTDDRRYSEAAQAAADILARWPEDAFAQRTGAALLSESRNGQEALNAAWNGVRLAPREAEAHLVLAVVAARLRLFDLAQRGYGEALELDAAIGDAQHQVGVVRLERRRWAAALEQLADEATLPPAPDPAAQAPGPTGQAPDSTARPSGPSDAAPGSTGQVPGPTGQAPDSTARPSGPSDAAPGSTGQVPGSTGQVSGSTGQGPASTAEGLGAAGQRPDSTGEESGAAGQGQGSTAEGSGAAGQGPGSTGDGLGAAGQGSGPTGQGLGAAGQGSRSPGRGSGAAGQKPRSPGRGSGVTGWGSGSAFPAPGPEVSLPTGPVLDRSGVTAAAVRQAVLIGANSVLVAAVLSAVMNLTSSGVARMWAGMMGVIILAGVAVWLSRELRPESIGVVFGRAPRKLVLAAYATALSSVLLVLHAVIGGLIPLIVAMVVAVGAELVVLTRRA